MSFAYTRPDSWALASSLLQDSSAQPLGGGTDLIPLIREHRQSPARVVDLRGIDQARRIVREADGSITIGAAVTLRELARDATIGEQLAALSQACQSVGSYALRAMGTLGGNLNQHVRCWYYRQGHECLRLGATRCSAIQGENQYHAIFQQGPCVAVHPSDPAVALHALDAQVNVQGSAGARTVAIADFFAPSRDRLDGTTVLGAGEVVTSVTIPAHSSGGVQFYEKSMQRGAWDFALVSLAALRRADGEVRLVLGGVANTPWRVTDSIEEDVASGGLAEDDIETLAQRALYDAKPLSGNAYKLDIAGALLRRAMTRLVAS